MIFVTERRIIEGTTNFRFKKADRSYRYIMLTKKTDNGNMLKYSV